MSGKKYNFSEWPNDLPPIGQSPNWESQKMMYELMLVMWRDLQDLKEQLKYKRRPGKEYIGATEAAEFYGVSKDTIYRIAKDPTTCVNRYQPTGRNAKFKITELDKYFTGSAENDR